MSKSDFHFFPPPNKTVKEIEGEKDISKKEKYEGPLYCAPSKWKRKKQKEEVKKEE